MTGMEQNLEEFKAKELEEIKKLYEKLDAGTLDNDDLEMFRFYSKEHLEKFRNTFNRFYKEVSDNSFGKIDKIETVNYILQRNKYCSLAMSYRALLLSYANGRSKEDIKNEFKSNFDGRFAVVPIFKPHEWDSYDLFDIKNKIFIAAREEMDIFLQVYPCLLGKHNTNLVYQMLDKSLDIVM